MKTLAVWLIKAYQWTIAPLLGDCCRFVPTCSHYAAEAIGRHGVLKGGWISCKRIFKCRPGHPGGHDPVP